MIRSLSLRFRRAYRTWSPDERELLGNYAVLLGLALLVAPAFVFLAWADISGIRIDVPFF